MSEDDRPLVERVDDPAFRLAARQRGRDHVALLARGEAHAGYRVGLAGTLTLEPLVPFATSALLESGVVPELRLAPYGQVFQACLDHRAAFGVGGLDAIVLLWRVEDLMRDELTLALAGDDEALASAEGKLTSLAAAVGTLREAFAGTVVVGVPPFPEPPEADLLDLRVAQRGLALHARLRHAWLSAVQAAAPAVLTLDLDALQRVYGSARAFDPRTAYLYRQPWSEGFLALVGERLAATLAATRVAPRKCLALDCDNTLWGGIVGEEGPEGVAVGDDFPGSAYRDFQRLLVAWQREGVLLALLSRNNEADVWQVFDAHPDMPLRREHVAAWSIGWGPKPEGLSEIAQTLGIGVASIVFVDDSAAEVAEMQAAWPQVRSLRLPEDPARIVEHVLGQRLFDRLGTTGEDAQRTRMMASEAQRGAARARLTHEEFLASLGLTVRVWRAREDELLRVAQLVAKTNQFNLTTIRRSQDELRTLMSSTRHRVFVLSASDRFGEYGLTGVAIVSNPSGRPELDTFLLSCRVLGRGVETAFLAAVTDDLRQAGARSLSARFVPTARNAPAADFLPRHGFREEGGSWRADVSEVPGTPSHVTAVPPGAPAAPGA